MNRQQLAPFRRKRAPALVASLRGGLAFDFMRTRQWVLIGTLLALPAWAPAAEPAEPDKPMFDLRDESVQGILRATAAANESAAQQTSTTGSKVEAELADIRFRAPRRVHHTECDSEDCVAYTADNEALFTLNRGVRTDLDSMNTEQLDDAWLSCQDTNNLLSTFERFDRCRGIRVGPPPLDLGRDRLDLPKIRL
jgi:hypothetical protein